MIDPEIQSSMGESLRPGETMLWGRVTREYRIEEALLKSQDKLGLKAFIVGGICILPSVALLHWMGVNWVAGIILGLIAWMFLGLPVFGPAISREVAEQRKYNSLIGGFIVTNQRIIQLDYLLRFRRAVTAPADLKDKLEHSTDAAFTKVLRDHLKTEDD